MCYSKLFKYDTYESAVKFYKRENVLLLQLTQTHVPYENDRSTLLNHTYHTFFTL